eukprot:scaffold244819_cov27-Tisochrysis_lutea.AAC.1
MVDAIRYPKWEIYCTPIIQFRPGRSAGWPAGSAITLQSSPFRLEFSYSTRTLLLVLYVVCTGGRQGELRERGTEREEKREKSEEKGRHQ